MCRYLVGIGEILWDMLPSGKMPGGAPANFAHNAAVLGQSSVFISAIGADAEGDQLIDTINSHNINHCLQRNDHPTGLVNVALDVQGIPAYDIVENSAWDYIEYTPELHDCATKAVAVCWGTLAQRNEVSRQTIVKFVENTPDDCIRIFDINLRQHYYDRDIIEQSLLLCDTLKINDEELIAVSELLDLGNNPCRELMQRYSLKTVIVTCGAYGSYIHTDEGTSYLPTPRVNVVDTIGAGDAFASAYVVSTIRGKDVAEAHRIAVDWAAEVCTHAGAMI
ncbi:MAG: carbohydrate kinase [Muribaculaceae bacterium]|nr:carbohydrate kinase [Muribaculaceae bacterium]